MIHKYLIKSISTGLPKTIGTALFTVALIPLIIRNTGMEKYGVWSLSFMFVGMSSALDIGIPKALVYLIPKTKQQEETNSIFIASVFITSILLSAVIIIGLAVVFFNIPVWGSREKIPRELSDLLVLSGVIIVCCTLVSSLCYSLLEAYYKIYIVNISYFFMTLLHYGLVFAVSRSFDDVKYLIYATNAAYITMAVVSVLLVTYFTRIGFSRLKSKYIRTVLTHGKDFFVIGLLTSVSMPIMRYLIIVFSDDMSMCGIYDISLKIGLLGNAILASFSIPLFSLFSGYGAKKIEAIKRVLVHMFALLLSMLAAGVALYYFVGYDILIRILKTNDPHIFMTSLILLIGWGVISVFEPYIRALWALGHTKKCAVIRLTVLIMNIVFIVIFGFVSVPLYRVSLSIALSLAIGGVLHFLLFYKLYGFRSTGVTVNG